MADPEVTWQDAIDKVRWHVVRIRTPRGSGTGFFFHRSRSGVVAIATAAHVVDEAHYWEEPIRIQQEGTEAVVARVAERAIFLDERRDTAAIVLSKTVTLPDTPLDLVPEDQRVRVGVDIGWLGYPAVAPEQLCFFGGRVSAFKPGEYLVDGVAINGVSGGPAFHLFSPDEPVLMGVLSAYIPNRAAVGAALPGLAVIRDLSHLHEVIKDLASFEQAKEEETPPTEPPTDAKAD